MQVKILYFRGCPNWQKAVDRTRTALAELGRVDVAIQLEDVNQKPQLPRHWAGSPTVLVNGQDPFVADGSALGDDRAGADGRSAAPAPGRDACRMYRTGAGLEGAPSADQLRTALSVAFDSSKNRERS